MAKALEPTMSHRVHFSSPHSQYAIINTILAIREDKQHSEHVRKVIDMRPRKENGFIGNNKHKEDNSPLGGDGGAVKQQKLKILKRGESTNTPTAKNDSQSKENISNKISNVVTKEQQQEQLLLQKNTNSDERIVVADSLKSPVAPLPVLVREKSIQITQSAVNNSSRQQLTHLVLQKQSSPPVRPSSSTTPTATGPTTTSTGSVTPQGSLPSLPSYNILNPSVPLVLTKSSSVSLPSTSSSTAALLEQHIQSISARLFGTTNSSIMMKSSMKIIDDTLVWCENGQIQQYLHDTEGNLVIGALGRQHVGKSTLLSLLGGNQFTDEDRTMIFQPSSQFPISMPPPQLTSSSSSTSTQSSATIPSSKSSNSVSTGIDLYVTSERTILLDTQPLLSSSLLQNLIENEQNREQHQQHHRRHYNHHYRDQQERHQDSQHLWQQLNDPNSMYIDNMIELQSIEIACFIMSVCHVVLIIEDQFADPYIYRLLQLAEILRPVIKTNQRELIRQHSPHLIFVMNKCDDYIQPHERLIIKKAINNLMCETRFFYRGSLNYLNKLKVRTSTKNILLSMMKNMNNNRMMKMNGGTNDNGSGDKGGLKKLFQNKNKSTTKMNKMLAGNDLDRQDDTITEDRENESEDEDEDDPEASDDYKLHEDEFEDENDEDEMDNESEEENGYRTRAKYLNSYDDVNAVFIPRRDFRVSSVSHWQSRFIGFSNPDSTIRQLRQQLLSIDRPLIDQCLSQRAWLNHASRVWDSITKSNWIADYSRLMT
ncbi:unnamed protein product [Didymodactylos carnosus]|uniref:Protein SMG9-like n=1 Tax=Didymodactylos carnosus TaxID=1234261 RepID=A0A813SBM4_9BILA|nr:unnamed protein product [Didymodactylos carnosus]CAF0844993.1 unnamed protein product [Didymodactylos carnosus]CAF3582926.1 unnamed protein product [Didymodactylos carnosus]CAF3630166.1 unnamed protein product [Didymodactylos carnosus]